MVVDTSVILAVYFDDPQAAWAAEQLTRHAGQLRMSTVNLTEGGAVFNPHARHDFKTLDVTVVLP